MNTLSVNKNLFLHVGWSKTGTSAIQNYIVHNYDWFERRGLLYPKSLRWADGAHHHLALSFKPNPIFSAQFNQDDALDQLEKEIKDSDCNNVLISSELSPNYFHFENFCKFVSRNFSSVKVVFTVRLQSELILSLFNQLVKDPMVRYNSTLFELYVKNVNWLNYFHSVDAWVDYVGCKNILVIGYGDNLVSRFFDKLGFKLENDSTVKVNSSFDNRLLLLAQYYSEMSSDVAEYGNYIRRLSEISSDIGGEHCKAVLFSKSEQASIDRYFESTNQKLNEKFLLDYPLKVKQQYLNVTVFPKLLPVIYPHYFKCL